MSTTQPIPVTVQESDADSTYPLWRDVLRDGQSIARIDDPVGTFHLAAHAPDGSVVGVVRFSPGECPWRSDAVTPWQLRGMATDLSVRGSGAGRLLVAEGLRRVVELGGDLVWCDAREGAVGFYERMGFAVGTDPYDKTWGVHVGMAIELPASRTD